MHLTIDNQEYTFWFQYYWVRQNGTRIKRKPPQDSSGMKEWRRNYREATACVIATIRPGGSETIYTKQTVRRFWKDLPSRRAGREFALLKAVKALVLLCTPFQTPSAEYTYRELRFLRAFQEAYLLEGCTKSDQFQIVSGTGGAA